MMSPRTAYLRYLLALLVWSCGDSGADPDTTGTAPEPEPGNGASTDSRAMQLEVFPRSLDLAPGDTATLHLSLAPEGVYNVRAALLGQDIGAFLDASEFETDATGQASLNVTVATESPAFGVRISVGSMATEIPVSPRSQILADALVVPDYDGKRPVNTWHVTVEESADCVDSAAYAQRATRAFPFGEPIELEQLPAGRPRTILVRGEDYIFGCKSDVVLDPTQLNRIEIPLADKPLQLGTISMPLALGVAQSPELQTVLNGQIEQMVAAFNGGLTDSAALLEEMALASDAPESMRQRIVDEDWEATLTTQLGADGAADGLSRVVRSWLFSASQRLYTNDTLSGQLDSTTSTTGKATYTLSSVAGVSPREAGVPSLYLATLGTDVDDRLRIGFELYFQPSRLLSAVAVAEARTRNQEVAAPSDDPAEEGEPSTAEALLASTLDCDTLGSTLEQGASASTISSPSEACAASCLSDLCENALGNMWDGAALSTLDAARLELSADANAQTDTAANVLSVSGDWVGNIQVSPNTPPLPLRGPLTTDNDNASP